MADQISNQRLLEELARLQRENDSLRTTREELDRVEEEMRIMNDAGIEGIMIHQKGVLIKANERYYQIFQYQPEELLGKQVLPLTVVPESLDFKTRRTTPDGVTTYEILGKKKNGDTFAMEVRGKMIDYRNQKVRRVTVMDISERKRVEQAFKESEEMLRFLSTRLFLAQEEERSRLSKELHDQLGHDLVLLKSRLRSHSRRLEENPLQKEVETTIEVVDQIIEDVRRLSRDLKPSLLEDLGLFASIQWLVENFSKQYQLRINLDMADIDHLFSRDIQLSLYRIFQESLTNIAKHSGAQNVSVEIKKIDGNISFSVNDDGKGFELKKVLTRKFHEKGVGLTAMKERMHMLGGSFDADSQPGRGTTISFSVPLETKEA